MNNFYAVMSKPTYVSSAKITTRNLAVGHSVKELKAIIQLLLSIMLSLSFYLHANEPIAAASFKHKVPTVQKASRYQSVDDIDAYWVSEKLDGVRARWTGKKLISRNGHPFNAPAWFIAKFPATPLDGELWIGRGQFERVSGIVRQHQPNDKLWQQVKYMLFDAPESLEPFTLRIKQMEQLVQKAQVSHLRVIPQLRLNNETELQQLLDKVVASGAEGLMLHHGEAKYQDKRVAHLLKLKKHQDAEAIVIAHLPGKGKFTGMLGAIKVRDDHGVEFKIGTGFSNEQRKSPPAIGSVVTFKYFGKTSNNKPRFASFLRVRYEVGSEFAR